MDITLTIELLRKFHKVTEIILGYFFRSMHWDRFRLLLFLPPLNTEPIDARFALLVVNIVVLVKSRF